MGKTAHEATTSGAPLCEVQKFGYTATVNTRIGRNMEWQSWLHLDFQ